MHNLCYLRRMLCSLSPYISGGSVEVTVDTPQRPCPRGIHLPSPPLHTPPAAISNSVPKEYRAASVFDTPTRTFSICCHRRPLSPIPFRCCRPRGGCLAPWGLPARRCPRRARRAHRQASCRPSHGSLPGTGRLTKRPPPSPPALGRTRSR